VNEQQLYKDDDNNEGGMYSQKQQEIENSNEVSIDSNNALYKAQSKK
jgi:hypothetical protein